MIERFIFDFFYISLISMIIVNFLGKFMIDQNIENKKLLTVYNTMVQLIYVLIFVLGLVAFAFLGIEALKFSLFISLSTVCGLYSFYFRQKNAFLSSQAIQVVTLTILFFYYYFENESSSSMLNLLIAHLILLFLMLIFLKVSYKTISMLNYKRSASFLLYSVTSTLTANVDSVLVSTFLSGTDFAIYRLAYSILSIPLLIATPIINRFAHIFRRNFVTDKVDDNSRIFIASALLIFCLGIVCYLFFLSAVYISNLFGVTDIMQSAMRIASMFFLPFIAISIFSILASILTYSDEVYFLASTNVFTVITLCTLFYMLSISSPYQMFLVVVLIHALVFIAMIRKMKISLSLHLLFEMLRIREVLKVLR